MTLPAFAAERRRTCCTAHARAAVDRYLLPAGLLSSKPAGCRCCCRSTGQTVGRTLDRYLVHRPCSAYYAGSANKLGLSGVVYFLINKIWLDKIRCACSSLHRRKERWTKTDRASYSELSQCPISQSRWSIFVDRPMSFCSTILSLNANLIN